MTRFKFTVPKKFSRLFSGKFVNDNNNKKKRENLAMCLTDFGRLSE